MKRIIIILSVIVSFYSCKKDSEEKVTPSPPEEEQGINEETYSNLKTTLVFEEEFNDLISWQVDTSIEVLDYPINNEATVNNSRCRIVSGSVFLKSYYKVTYDSVTNKYQNTKRNCEIKREIGALPISKQYLVELDLGILRSYRRYHTESGNHNSTGGNRGTQVFLTLNGVQYEIFGKHITEEINTPQNIKTVNSDCITTFNETTLKLIIDSVDLNNTALNNGELAELCTNRIDTLLGANEIRIRVNPRVDGSFGIGAPNINSSKADSCIISSIRLYSVN